MSNSTFIDAEVNDINVTSDDVYDYFDETESAAPFYVRTVGIAISSVCLILQFVLYIKLPKIRKLDQKILTHLTVARVINSIIELLITYQYFDIYTRDLIFALYFQTDAALIFWMFVFTKNLYEKVVLVFVLKKIRFLILSLLVWILAVPIGVLCPVSLVTNFFSEYYKVYIWIKFIILTINLLVFGRIFYVIINKSLGADMKMKVIIKSCIISFLLLCLTSILVIVQVILNDILMTADFKGTLVTLVNNYQAVLAIVIFLILVKSCVDKN